MYQPSSRTWTLTHVRSAGTYMSKRTYIFRLQVGDMETPPSRAMAHPILVRRGRSEQSKAPPGFRMAISRGASAFPHSPALSPCWSAPESCPCRRACSVLKAESFEVRSDRAESLIL